MSPKEDDAGVANLQTGRDGLVHRAVGGFVARAAEPPGRRGNPPGRGRRGAIAWSLRFPEMSERHVTRLLACERATTNIARAPENGPSAWFWHAVEVVRGVDRALDALLSSVEHLLAGVEPDEVGVDLVILVQMCRQAESVAERAVDDAVGPPVRRLQIVTVQVVSRPGHAPVDPTLHRHFAAPS